MAVAVLHRSDCDCEPKSLGLLCDRNSVAVLPLVSVEDFDLFQPNANPCQHAPYSSCLDE